MITHTHGSVTVTFTDSSAAEAAAGLLQCNVSVYSALWRRQADGAGPATRQEVIETGGAIIRTATA